MRSAATQVFPAATEAGAAAPRSRAAAWVGAVLAGRPVAVLCLAPVGVPRAMSTTGMTCDWVRRQLL
jgi:hypothetical protein